MEISLNEINQYLITIFREVQMIEEKMIKRSPFSDLTVKEVHSIDAIGLSGEKTLSDVAKKLKITVSTASVSVQKLVKRGYVVRQRAETDRRSYKLILTKDGRIVYRLYRKFHYEMVKDTIDGLDKDEMQILVKGLGNLYAHLDKIQNNLDQLEGDSNE